MQLDEHSQFIADKFREVSYNSTMAMTCRANCEKWITLSVSVSSCVPKFTPITARGPGVQSKEVLVVKFSCEPQIAHRINVIVRGLVYDFMKTARAQR